MYPDISDDQDSLAKQRYITKGEIIFSKLIDKALFQKLLNFCKSNLDGFLEFLERVGPLPEDIMNKLTEQ